MYSDLCRIPSDESVTADRSYLAFNPHSYSESYVLARCEMADIGSHRWM